MLVQMKKVNSVGHCLGLLLAFIVAATYGWAAKDGGGGTGFALFILIYLILTILSLVISFFSGILAAFVMFLIFVSVFFGGRNGGLADSVKGLSTIQQQYDYLQTQYNYHGISGIHSSSKIDYVSSIKYRIKESWIDYSVYVGDGKYTEGKFDVAWHDFEQWFLTEHPENEKPPLPIYLGETDQIKMMAERD